MVTSGVGSNRRAYICLQSAYEEAQRAAALRYRATYRQSMHARRQSCRLLRAVTSCQSFYAFTPLLRWCRCRVTRGRRMAAAVAMRAVKKVCLPLPPSASGGASSVEVMA